LLKLQKPDFRVQLTEIKTRNVWPAAGFRLTIPEVAVTAVSWEKLGQRGKASRLTIPEVAVTAVPSFTAWRKANKSPPHDS
jgi:hypothetical protein